MCSIGSNQVTNHGVKKYKQIVTEYTARQVSVLNNSPVYQPQ